MSLRFDRSKEDVNLSISQQEKIIDSITVKIARRNCRGEAFECGLSFQDKCVTSRVFGAGGIAEVDAHVCRTGCDTDDRSGEVVGIRTRHLTGRAAGVNRPGKRGQFSAVVDSGGLTCRLGHGQVIDSVVVDVPDTLE